MPHAYVPRTDVKTSLCSSPGCGLHQTDPVHKEEPMSKQQDTPSQEQLRLSALDQARMHIDTQIARHGNMSIYSPENVVQAAEKFYAFLSGATKVTEPTP